MSATWDSKGVKGAPLSADEVLIIDTEDSRNQKRATLSTLPTNIPAFSASTDYVVGDVVIEDGITLRAITPITAGAFDQSDWVVSDGMGVKNTVQVYVEDDFGPLVSDRHLLTADTEYIVCAPIDMNNGLQMASSCSNSLRSFSKEVNKIEWEGTGFFVITTDIELAYTAVSFSVDTLTFTMADTTGLAIGEFVNINGGTYQLTNQEITGLIANTSIDILGADQGTDTGNVDTFANKLECTDVEIEGDGSNSGFDCRFTQVGTSEWFALHCDFEELVTPLNLNGASLMVTHLCEFEEAGPSVYNEFSSNIIHTANSYTEPTLGSVNLEISGNDTDVINAVIANNSFESGESVSSITVDTGGSGYTSVPTVTIDAPPSGTTATATAVLAEGIGTAAINAVGSGYLNLETVELTGDTSGANNARGIASVTGGEIDTIAITVIGSGYNENEDLDVLGLTSGSSNATATSVTTEIVDSITVDTIGSGYTSVPDVTITVTNGGSGATATAVLINAIHIHEPVDFPDATRFIVTGNLDKNASSFSLFDIVDDGKDETDNQVIVQANAKQKNSQVFAEMYNQAVGVEPSERAQMTMTAAFTFSDIIDIGNANTPDVNLQLWQNRSRERFQVNNELNGEIQYTGLEDITVSVTYSGTLKSGSSAVFSSIAVFQDSGSGFVQVEDSDAFSQNTGGQQFSSSSRTIAIPISPGDKLKLQAKNVDDADTLIQWLFMSYTVSG